MDYLVWVGPRDSDIQFSRCIKDTICYYSNKNPMPYRKAHIYGETFLKFVESKMKCILQTYSEAKFIFYNPKIAYSLSAELQQNILCLNEKYVLDLLNNKIYTRYWFGSYVPVLPSILLDSRSISFDELNNKLTKAEAYIVQKNNSSGGFGTFFVSENNGMLDYVNKFYNELFIISPYIQHSFSVNINALVYEEEISLFPPSIQIVEKSKNRLLYHGADYKAAQKLPIEIRKKLRDYSYIILQHIQLLGYRGIIGIDFIVESNNVYFQEINPRYQASSFLIDLALYKQDLPSLTEMNISAFVTNKTKEKDWFDFPIDYSFYKYLYAENAKHLYHVEKIALGDPLVAYMFLDGWNSIIKTEEDSYCYSLVFATNIISLNFEGGYNLYSNITGEEEYINENISTPIGLKIALLNQGCTLDKKTTDFLDSNGTIKKAVFSAIDFQLSNGIFINAPVGLKFTGFTPFNIKICSKTQPVLYYYEKPISEIKIEMQPTWINRMTQNKIPFSKIAYLSSDRLRLKHQPVCALKKTGNGCSFCSIPIGSTTFSMDDIKEVITELLKNPTFRHILIGGGSGKPDVEYKEIIEISKMIRNINSKIPIYLMSLPPTEPKILELYKNAGITEVAFNIEIWNRNLAQKIMPGKGSVSLNSYLDILKASTFLWGTTGNVRTALIVGLDKCETLLKGIQVLCENGIQPMLSVFRPMPNTKLNYFVPLSNTDLLSFYNKAQKICEQYGLRLGPTCDACKNNMLSI